MKTKWIKYGVLGVLGIQFISLLGGIGFMYWILQTGNAYELKMRGFDPYDPLRGRYIQLRLEDNEVESSYDEYREGDRPIYITLEGNHLSKFYFEKPNEDYIKTKAYTLRETDEGLVARVYLNLDTYYINEKKAPEVEKLIRDGDVEVLLRIKVNKGYYAIDQLIVGGISY